MGVLDAQWSVWGEGVSEQKWKLSQQTDQLHRRILLEANNEFDNHEDASYSDGLERDREKAERDRAERKEKQEEMVRRAALKAGGESMEEVEEVDEEEGEGGGGDGGGEDEPKEGDDDFYLVQNEDSRDEFAWATQGFKWEKKERVVMVSEVIVVGPSVSVRGNMLLTNYAIYFHPEKQLGTDVETTGSAGDDVRWMLDRIVSVYGRRYILRPQAVEIFFANVNEVFMSFEGGVKMRDKFYSKLRNLNCPMLKTMSKSLVPRQVFSKLKITDLWRRRKMSNFEYLMRLNLLAGRSFNDITQYPVFPWVLADYTSDTIDLSDPAVYRDLTKPIGALNQDRLDGLLERFHDMDGFDENYKFLYGSHYSSPGVVLHYLIRQEPFTTMAISLQGGRFDVPDRLFFDIASSWKCCQTNSGDFMEMVPEMFCVPEVLLNTNKFPFGTLQDNRGQVDDVILPPWAKGSAHEFIRVNRLALESEYVSQHLHSWIDLIFGYKQRGPDAIKANNLFHNLSYEGAVDIDKIEDVMERKAAEAHIQNFGQCPSQLLTRKDGRHPKRAPATECWTQLFSSNERVEGLNVYNPPNQTTNGTKVLALSIVGETLRVVHEDFQISNYFFSPQGKDNLPFTLKLTGKVGVTEAVSR